MAATWQETMDDTPCERCVLGNAYDAAVVELTSEITGPVSSATYEATDQGVRVTTDDGKNIILNI